MPKRNPPHLSSDMDRHGNRRWYVRRPGRRKVRLRHEYGSDAFWQAYRDALAGKLAPRPEGPERLPKPQRGTLRWLIASYMDSAEFKTLDASTRRVRRRILERLAQMKDGTGREIGGHPYTKLETRHVRKIRDRHAERPAAANAFVKAVRQLYAWAIEAELSQANPGRDVKYLAGSPEGIRSWTRDDVETFASTHPRGTKAYLALELMLTLTVRRSDVMRIGPKHVQDGEIHFTEAKNARRKPKHHVIPMPPHLIETIKATPHGEDTFLTTDFGKPFASAAAFGNKMRDWCDAAGLPNCSAHGLRKLGAAVLAESGASNREIMAITGHETSKEVDRYTKTARRKVLAASAIKKQVVPLPQDEKKSGAKTGAKPLKFIADAGGLVPGGGIEPPTLRFSVACSTN